MTPLLSCSSIIPVLMMTWLGATASIHPSSVCLQSGALARGSAVIRLMSPWAPAPHALVRGQVHGRVVMARVRCGLWWSIWSKNVSWQPMATAMTWRNRCCSSAMRS